MNRVFGSILIAILIASVAVVPDLRAQPGDICHERAALVDELLSLQPRRALLRQVVTNYGFADSVVKIEDYGSSAAETIEQSPSFKDQVMELTGDAAKTALASYLDGLIDMLKTGDPSATMQRVAAVADRLGLREQYHAMILQQALADDPTGNLEKAKWVLERIENWDTGRDLVRAAQGGKGADEAQWKTLVNAASTVATTAGGPFFGWLVKADMNGLRNLGAVATLLRDKFNIDKLSRMSGADLESLKTTSSQLAAVDKRIGEIDKRLRTLDAQAASCDSTKLVKPEPNPAPAAGDPAAPQKPAHRGMSKGAKIALATGVIGGGGIATGLIIGHYVECASDPSSCSNNDNNGGGDWSILSHTAFVCSSATRRCSSGTITINVPVAISAGSSTAVAAEGSGGGFMNAVARTSGATSVTYDFTGSQSALNCQSITFVNVYDGFTNTGTFLKTVDASIPVSCQ